MKVRDVDVLVEFVDEEALEEHLVYYVRLSHLHEMFQL